MKSEQSTSLRIPSRAMRIIRRGLYLSLMALTVHVPHWKQSFRFSPPGCFDISYLNPGSRLSASITSSGIFSSLLAFRYRLDLRLYLLGSVVPHRDGAARAAGGAGPAALAQHVRDDRLLRLGVHGYRGIGAGELAGPAAGALVGVHGGGQRLGLHVAPHHGYGRPGGRRLRL